MFAGSYYDIRWSNVMWLYLTGTGVISNTVRQALCDSLYGKYASKFMPSLFSASILDVCELTVWDSGEATQSITTSAAVPGGVTGVGLPANVAVCITWRIAPHYRGGHPRTYLCGLAQSAMNNGTSITPTLQSTLQTKANEFHTEVEALTPGTGISTVEHGAMSFVVAGAWRTPPIFRRILTARVDTRFDSQRRRLGKDRI